MTFEYKVTEQDSPGAAGHFKDFLVERKDEIESVRLENDEHKGLWITTVDKVESWLDEMWGVYLEEHEPGGPIE